MKRLTHTIAIGTKGAERFITMHGTRQEAKAVAFALDLLKCFGLLDKRAIVSKVGKYRPRRRR